LDNILAITPNLDELKEFCISQSIDIITVFTGETADQNNAFRTRVFAPTFGYLEDPATGSGNAAFGYYLLQNGKVRGKFITLEQNSFIDNANLIKLELSKDEHGGFRVAFGGSAVVRINGEYQLV
jgi:PhzF family phenazine biosynthesis protein